MTERRTYDDADGAGLCGEAFDHDEEVVWSDDTTTQWVCRRCGAEGWSDDNP